MRYSHLFELLKTSNLSPEDFGKIIGVSGMTLRRWLSKPKNALVPKLYVPAIREACYQLIADELVAVDAPCVQVILDSADDSRIDVVMQCLGLPKNMAGSMKSSQDGMLMGLSHIGSHEAKQNEVNSNQKKLFSFRKMSEDWSKRISLLWDVLQSKRIGSVDKLIAYGALFYLLTPIDFIPDHIPVFGLVDDFGVLGIAASYYTKRFPDVAVTK